MRAVPRAVGMTFVGLGVAPEQHATLLKSMADAGDWYAVHWRSCGLLSGVMASKMCAAGHKPQPGDRELEVAEVRELIKELG